MSEASRIRALAEAGLMHPHAEAVVAPLFAAGGFFLAADKVQVKYEMLRAHLVDGISVTDAAALHGYSRAGFYLVQAGFDRDGMTGLLDDKRGRRGPVKLTAAITEFLHAAPASASGAALAEEVAGRFGVRLHRRTVERVRRQ
jgi:transposase